MEVVDNSPRNGAQALSSSAVDFSGLPAVVYCKQDGLERPRLVIASRGLTGWDIQTIATPRGSEGFLGSDAVTINGQTFAAVAYDATGHSGVPNSLRILDPTPFGCQPIFYDVGGGKYYGRFVRVARFNSRL